MKIAFNFFFCVLFLILYSHSMKTNLKNKQVECKPGFSPVGDTCYANCPKNFISIHGEHGKAECKGQIYPRSGYLLTDAGKKKCEEDNSQGCEEWWGMWKAKCLENFTHDGCCSWYSFLLKLIHLFIASKNVRMVGKTMDSWEWV